MATKKKCKCECCGAVDDSFHAPAEALDYLRMNAGAKPEVVGIAWEREDGHVYRYDVYLPRNIQSSARPFVVHLVERCVKFVLWAAGGWKLYLAGPDWIVQPIAKDYTAKGARKFDYNFFKDLYGKPFEVVIVPYKKMPVTNEREVIVKNNTNGNRIGFDLGASDFKISALKNGKVVFYELTSGSITIDGIDISKIPLGSLRNNIGMVQQDVYLFSGTVYENILYGKPDATRDEVIEAARAAGAHDFIMELKDGYDTYVGERGLKLSGGQKQRVSIARLFLKNPPILILDEATSALDNESELLVQKSLKRLSEGRTTFTIAHRLTTIKNATRIFVLT
ncbi:MAG: ATP-binding cassette domain-containing protein, partial [Kiritimatiellae bacterium]|nr:ATP-binding cassette domain-containing protein [Kiritimatiellia bacterium]